MREKGVRGGVREGVFVSEGGGGGRERVWQGVS